MTRQRILRSTAFHEAGHAVAKLYAGYSPPLVSIDADGKTGFCAPSPAVYAKVRAGQYLVWDVLVILLAGVTAESKISRRSFHSYFEDDFNDGGRNDFEDMQKPLSWLVSNGYSDSRADAMNRAREETNAFVRQQWACIERVAVELISSGRIEPENLLSISGYRELPRPAVSRLILCNQIWRFH